LGTAKKIGLGIGIIIFGLYVFVVVFWSLPIFVDETSSIGLNVSAVMFGVFIFLGIPTLIIILIVLKIKRKLTTKTLKIILLGAGVFLVGDIVIGVSSQSSLSDEEKAERADIREIEEQRAAEGKKIKQALEEEAKKQQEAEERRYQAELERQRELEEAKKLEEQRAKEVEESWNTAYEKYCPGVDAVDVELYGTQAELCLLAITGLFYDWCLQEELKISKTGAEDRALECQQDIISRLVKQCEDSDDQGVFSVSPDVCTMSNLKYVYQELQDRLD